MKPPFRSILCPTDLSPAGDRAAAVAFALAAPAGTVHLLHVWEPAYALSPLDAAPVVALPATPQDDAAHEKRVEAHLRRLVPPDDASEKGPSSSRARVEIHVAKVGDTGATIAEECRRVHADAIVMGTHGRSGLARAMMGSVAMSVFRHANVPVILVRDPDIA